MSLEKAESSLRNRAGRLEADRRVGDRVALVRGHRVSFAHYARLEARLLRRLELGEHAESVLDSESLPKLARSSWSAFAAEIYQAREPTAEGEAVAWFSDALLELAAGHKPPKRSRSWSDMFAQASARHRTRVNVEAIWNDWVADVIWMLRWLPSRPFDVARAELATRLAVARLIQKRICKLGIPADQAAAEAVMICELTAEGEQWPDAVGSIVTKPSPAGSLI